MIKTVGASIILQYNDRFIFEIQKKHKWRKNNNGIYQIGVGCIGGNIENGETPHETLHREAMEEIGSKISIFHIEKPFTVDSSFNVSFLSDSEYSSNIFFYWHGTKETYLQNRICTFWCGALGEPYPDDIPGILITHLNTLFTTFETNQTLESILCRGAVLKAKEEIPREAIIFPVGTVKVLFFLYREKQDYIKMLLERR